MILMVANDQLDEFDAFYDRTVDQVLSYARARVGAVEAEDITSEVFAAALVALRNGRGEAVSEAWLIAVARNKVVDRWRVAERNMARLRRLQRRHLGPTVDSPASSAPIHEALDMLTTRHRSLLCLHYLDGYPMPQVAEMLGLSYEAARSGLARARRALATHYTEVMHDGQ